MNLKILSLLTLLTIVFYLVTLRKKNREISRNGCLILAGFSLLLIGRLADVCGDFRLFGGFLEGTVYEVILVDFLGGTASYLLLAGGAARCMPALASVKKLRDEVEKRKRTQEKLNKERSLLSGLLDSIPDAVFFKDARGIYLGCNPAFCELVKKPAGEVVGKQTKDLFSKDVAALLSTQDSELFEKEEVIVRERWDNYPDGRRVLLQTVKAPLYDETGTFIGLVGVSRDITERQKAEDAMLKARLAEDASRAKSEFLATMSHELRTPLNSIIGFSDLLLEGSGGSLSERQERYVRNVSSSGKHLLQLINDILDLSKVEAGKTELEPELFDVAEIFEELEGIFGSIAAGKKLVLKFGVSGQLTLKADKMRFKQVLYNLISNAIKFTPENGSVSVLAARDGDMVRVSVNDTGIGISDESMEYLFQPFRQLDSFLRRRYEGTGLGLFLVKKFVEMHGGNVRVESEPGKGSSFLFELPIKGPGERSGEGAGEKPGEGLEEWPEYGVCGTISSAAASTASSAFSIEEPDGM